MSDKTNKDYVVQHIQSSIELKNAIVSDGALLDRIVLVGSTCVTALQNGNKVMFAGNGGSAADAQHLAAELVGRYRFHRDGLPSIALTTDSSMLTAIANDYSFEQVFARQIQAQGKKGDVFVGISTSGNSKNVLLGIEQAKSQGITTVAFAGSGGEIQSQCDICINVPSDQTPFIQESHIMIGQIICGLIEDALFADQKPQ